VLEDAEDEGNGSAVENAVSEALTLAELRSIVENWRFPIAAFVSEPAAVGMASGVAEVRAELAAATEPVGAEKILEESAAGAELSDAPVASEVGTEMAESVADSADEAAEKADAEAVERIEEALASAVGRTEAVGTTAVAFAFTLAEGTRVLSTELAPAIDDAFTELEFAPAPDPSSPPCTPAASKRARASEIVSQARVVPGLLTSGRARQVVSLAQGAETCQVPFVHCAKADVGEDEFVDEAEEGMQACWPAVRDGVGG